VTKSLSPFVCMFVPFFLLVSLESVLHLDVSRKFQGSFKNVSREFQGRFKKVSRVFQERFKGVLRKFQGCFKKDSRVF